MNARIEDTVLSVYQRQGLRWAKLRGEDPAEGGWLDLFCGHLPRGASVLDIGSGSGVPIARELVQRGFDVTGVDGSSTMVALFRAHLPHTPVILQDMRQLALGKSFSGLLAWDSFFHLSPEDQRSMFSRLEAHAEPMAMLMFTSGPAEGSAVGDLEGDELYHASLGPDEYRTLLGKAGFEVLAHVAEDPTCGYRTVWLAQMRA